MHHLRGITSKLSLEAVPELLTSSLCLLVILWLYNVLWAYVSVRSIIGAFGTCNNVASNRYLPLPLHFPQLPHPLVHITVFQSIYDICVCWPNSQTSFQFFYFPLFPLPVLGNARPAVATQPICLQKTRANLVVGKRATIAGWGKMSTSSLRQPEMSHLDVPLTSWDLCLRNYGSTGALESPNSIEGQWMCAGGEGKDVCQGFGGAPLFIQENGIFSQVRFL